MPSIDPIQGDALKKALEDQHNAPRVWSAPPRMETSPTGPAKVPPSIVPYLAMLMGLATAWQAAELYDFGTKTWHLEKLATFILALGATLGIVSPGLRGKAPLAGILFALSLPAVAQPVTRATLLGLPEEEAMRRDAAELAALFAPKGLAGVSVARGRSSPMALAVLSVGLARLGPGELDADLGGGFTRFDGAEIVAGSLGVSYLWQSGPLQVGPAAGALYSSAGWSFYGALALAFPVGP